MADAVEEATNFTLPFGMGEVDITSLSAVAFIISLIGGSVVWNMADDIGEYGASVVNNKLGSVIGFNPATGTESTTGGAFD